MWHANVPRKRIMHFVSFKDISCANVFTVRNPVPLLLIIWSDLYRPYPADRSHRRGAWFLNLIWKRRFYFLSNNLKKLQWDLNLELLMLHIFIRILSITHYLSLLWICFLETKVILWEIYQGITSLNTPGTHRRDGKRLRARERRFQRS